MADFIEELVSSGDFNNQSEVIRAGVRLLQEQTAASKLSQLRQLIDEGDNSPDIENWSIENLIERLDNRSA